MTWLDGEPLLSLVDRPLEERNRIATALFHAWWRPFARYGVIHGDPHLGNYTVFHEDDDAGGGEPPRLWLHPHLSAELRGRRHRALSRLPERRPRGDRRGLSAIWGFRDLNDELVDTLSLWARFIYAPLLDDRVRTIADGVAPHTYGRREVWQVKQRLKPNGPVTIPREFVLMNRAAVGLGAVFLHLQGRAQFPSAFRSGDRGFRARHAGRAAGEGACCGGPLGARPIAFPR